MTAAWIPYGRQDVHDDDVDAVVRVLRSDFLTQGPVVPRFESAIAAYCGASHAVAVNSATSALHLACLALNLGPGDRLWTSPISFVASANCGRACGAEVDFVDIDPQTGNMSAAAFAATLRTAARAGRLPKVVVPVHFAGRPCEMERIHVAAREHGVRIIEDASHALGARYRGEPVGRGRYSDITVFSFHPVKVITTGEGGVAVTNNAALAERMARLRTHGITRDEAGEPWAYEQVELGFNYRLTDIQAALGLSQLPRLDGYVERRNALARRYDQLLAGLPVVPPAAGADDTSATHLYVVHLKPPHERQRVFARLRERGIGVQVHYIPIHTQPYYRALGFSPGDLPLAEAYYARALSLPVYPAMTERDQDRVVAELRAAL